MSETVDVPAEVFEVAMAHFRAAVESAFVAGQLSAASPATTGQPSPNGVKPRVFARPKLSRQESAVLLLYVAGLTLDVAARRAGIRPGTAKQYLARVKTKYEAAGRPTRTKLDLARRAREDGLREGF